MRLVADMIAVRFVMSIVIICALCPSASARIICSTDGAPRNWRLISLHASPARIGQGEVRAAARAHDLRRERIGAAGREQDLIHIRGQRATEQRSDVAGIGDGVEDQDQRPEPPTSPRTHLLGGDIRQRDGRDDTLWRPRLARPLDGRERRQ